MPLPELHHDDAGLSLVEVLVSTSILAVTLLAFASTAIAALGTIAHDEQHVRGVQRAAQVLESARSLPWEHVGFYANDPGYEATADDGAETVTLGATRPVGAIAPLPEETVVVNTVAYDVEREVVWVDDPDSPPPPQTDTDPNDYIEIRTTIRWQVAGEQREETQVTERHPTVEEVPLDVVLDCTAGDILDFAIAPDPVILDPAGRTEEDISVTLTTCGSASSVSLDAPPLGPYQLDPVAGTDETEWTSDAFPAGTTGLSPGTYVWQATAYSGYGVETATAELRLVEASTEVLEVTSATIDPVLCVKTGTGVPHRDSTVTVTITGAGVDDQVETTFLDDAAALVSSALTATGPDEVQLTGTVDGSSTFDSTTTTLSVSVDRVEDGAAATATFVFDVERANGGGQCP